jgi:hypothetical protein
MKTDFDEKICTHVRSRCLQMNIPKNATRHLESEMIYIAKRSFVQAREKGFSEDTALLIALARVAGKPDLFLNLAYYLRFDRIAESPTKWILLDVVLVAIAMVLVYAVAAPLETLKLCGGLLVIPFVIVHRAINRRAPALAAVVCGLAIAGELIVFLALDNALVHVIVYKLRLTPKSSLFHIYQYGGVALIMVYLVARCFVVIKLTCFFDKVRFLVKYSNRFNRLLISPFIRFFVRKDLLKATSN